MLTKQPLREAFWEHARQRVFFANTQVDRDVKHVMRHIVGTSSSIACTAAGCYSQGESLAS